MGNEEAPLWRRSVTHMLHAALMLKADVEDRLQAETDLLLADNEALLNLAHSDAPLRMSDIAHRLILSRGGTTKVIDRLEERGYVARTSDPEDRRATTVTITDQGRDALVRGRAVVDEALEELWAVNLSDDEARAVLDVADRVLKTNRDWDE